MLQPCPALAEHVDHLRAAHEAHLNIVEAKHEEPSDKQLPPMKELARLPLDPPPSRASEEVIALGKQKYARYCAVCHAPAAVGSTVLPDLRRSATIANKAAFEAVVHEGILKERGMVSFADSLSKEEIDAIREYIIKRANEDKAIEPTTKVARR